MSPTNPRWAWLLPAIVAAGLLAISAFSGYSRNDSNTASRITAVEVQQRNDTKAIDRIDAGVKAVDVKVDLILREMRASKR